jgi:hypothetical protein
MDQNIDVKRNVIGGKCLFYHMFSIVKITIVMVIMFSQWKI